MDIQAEQSAQSLSRAFIEKYPYDAARALETLKAEDAAEILTHQTLHSLLQVWPKLSPATAEILFMLIPKETAILLLSRLDPGYSTALLQNFSEEQRKSWLSALPPSQAGELNELLHYPADSAGHLMSTQIIAFEHNTRIADALTQLNRRGLTLLRHLFVVDSEQKLYGQVDIRQLVLADKELPLSALAGSVHSYVTALDPRDEVMEKIQKHHLPNLPVLDAHHRLVGIIYGADMIEALKEDIAADMQTMVGASPDERALSSSWFAVRKRLPWLQINLLTAFLAAAVVGFFENTIAQFTALAVLLPVAAGQAGNAGAQALAVTMRGLTLREITVRHWLRVSLKEAGAGFLNGISIAVTCGLGVYIWSRSFGLALVIALAMIISMTIAGIAGALVPIALKKLGQDPAQSSSIILTTVTDIAGFMSFLGIATLLATLL